MTGDESAHVTKLVTTRPEAEIAADLKQRLEKAIEPVAALIDEAAAQGLLVQWDGFAAGPPFFKHRPLNLRLVKHY
jgi:hypothetical protein